MTLDNQIKYGKLVPVMLCFFAMGFVDLVGIASNYVKADLNLSDAEANIFPSLVFFWFLIFSVPTGVLMNRIGRKNTVVLSLAVTFVSLLLPIFGDSYGIMLCSFSLLGIGNALMQTSLNPLLSNIITGDKLASSGSLSRRLPRFWLLISPCGEPRRRYRSSAWAGGCCSPSIWRWRSLPSCGSLPLRLRKRLPTRLRVSSVASGC